jgi:hypothetical protein
LFPDTTAIVFVLRSIYFDSLVVLAAMAASTSRGAQIGSGGIPVLLHAFDAPMKRRKA